MELESVPAGCQGGREHSSASRPWVQAPVPHTDNPKAEEIFPLVVTCPHTFRAIMNEVPLPGGEHSTVY